MRAAWLPLLALAALTASADAPPAGHERIPVINLQLDSEPKFESVVLPKPPMDEWILHVCIREYDAPAIRCYMLDTIERKWWTFDVKLAK